MSTSQEFVPPEPAKQKLSRDIAQVLSVLVDPEKRHILRCLIGSLIPLQVLPYGLSLIWPEILEPTVAFSMVALTVAGIAFFLGYGVNLFKNRNWISGGITLSLGIYFTLFMIQSMISVSNYFALNPTQI